MKLTHDELTAKGFVLGPTGYTKMTAKQIGEVTISDAGPKVLGAKAKRLRQRTKPLLNKLETQWLNELTARYPGDRIRAQAIRFELANGVMYTPDITRSNDRFIKAYEVKGPHAWDDAIVKLKVAARSYPEIGWVLVSKENGQWKEERVLA